ncbi:unnamed protein product [Ilex paraguariensis]|uniref:DCD domain-containing protein n=2 Tax=Ilex paraguariensis TaxID=185542 RepID=A0ABC8QWS7_9AQUA
MGTGRRTQTFMPNESAPFDPNQSARNLRKIHLGGVVFGCKNNTIRECLVKQLFGLPAQHFSYVKNIDPGLPLFLFNYSDRKLHGIFEAASSGQMNINPYAWTVDASERTLYPTQVQIRVRLQCQPLLEDQFKPVIMDNYFSHNHFWFELDHAQASRLISILYSQAVAPSTLVPKNIAMWGNTIPGLPSTDRREEKGLGPPASEVDLARFNKSNGNVGTSDASLYIDGKNQPLEACFGNQVSEKEEKELMYMKLKELALNRTHSDSPLMECLGEKVADMNLGHKVSVEAETFSGEKNEKNEEISLNSSDYPSIIAQLIREMEELKVFKTQQIQKMGYLEQKLVEAEKEIGLLKDGCTKLEYMTNPVEHADATIMESFDELPLELDELILLVGGYDGVSWLSALDAYSPSKDMIKALKPMGSVRSYASVARLNGELYVFGGGNGSLWYDTVESYNPANNQWTLCPSLNEKKGSLAGATLNGKIFALGGGNGIECFSDVEMFDLDVGCWISTRSMLQRRFALAATELNGVLYAVGGYDGKDYLKSAERFDPREHSWTRIESMNMRRGCHSLAVLNEKLYALGGYDGSTMVPSIEIFDPRLGTWMTGDPMNQSRGYSAAAVVKESLYVIGGVKSGDEIVDMVECFKDGEGWQATNLKAIGRRCFSSAIVLGQD